MRRIFVIIILCMCAIPGSAVATDDGRWPVHYVLPISTSIDGFPSAGLRMFAAELLNDLQPGVTLMDGFSTPDGRAAFDHCSYNHHCLAEHLGNLGVTTILHLEATQPQPQQAIHLTATLIRHDRIFTQGVYCSANWIDIRQKAAQAIIGARFQTMIADGTLPPPQDDNDGEELFIPLPKIMDTPARIDKRLGVLPWHVNIPAGSYPQGAADTTGDSSPRHNVTLPSFYMDKTEVPALAYAVCVAAGVCTAPVPHSKDAYCTWGMPDGMLKPVNCVTWHQARDYCAFRGGRLPSEAEWEAAARGTNEHIYPWGDAPLDCSHAVYAPVLDGKKGDGCGRDIVWNTGMLPHGRSPFGLMDMAGNVWEWVADWYQPDAYSFRKDDAAPQGPKKGTFRVIRGGSWLSTSNNALTTWHRARRDPNKPSNATGFRCAYDEARPPSP